MTFFLAVIIASPAGAHTNTASTTAELIEALVAGKRELPALSDVQDAAVATLGGPPDDDIASFGSRARWRAIVPRLEVVAGTDADLDVRDSFSAARSRTTTAGRAFDVQVGARWELGDAVFSEAELRASREILAHAAAVRLVRDEVTRIYFDRVAAWFALRRDPSNVELQVRAARLDGLLRAYAGSHLDLQRPRRGGSL